ncbi:MAG: hypothetical protein BWY85_02293 [Firmicutes bacterium ADurb.Bin506]|nr:MAG: hypothetical protein BWY85_02293 [Firmicutes bacterium ADurb.Bin506]
MALATSSDLAYGLYALAQVALPPDRAERQDATAQDVLARMLQAQENLISFEGTAAARVYIGDRNVLNTSVGLTIERPNHVVVRWLGMTIKPRHGLIFIDPQMFVSNGYTLSVVSAPAQGSRDASALSDRWIISAVASGSSQPELSWILHVEPDTWLIRRAQVSVGRSAAHTAKAAGGAGTAIIEADYRQAGYRRWEPVRLWAQGRMVLEEFLPGFLVNLVAGRGDSSMSGEIGDSPPLVMLDFGAGPAEAAAKGQSK